MTEKEEMTELTEEETPPKASPKAPKKLTIKEILALKKPVTKSVVVQLDGAVAMEITHLQEDIMAVRESEKMSNLPSQVPKLEEKLATLIETSFDTECKFEFSAIGRLAYDKLTEDPRFKPSPALAKEGYNFNPETFPAALISASCVEPEISIEQAQGMFDDPSWNAAELQRVFYAALECNTETGDTPLSLIASGPTLSSLRKLASQLNTESLTQSS